MSLAILEGQPRWMDSIKKVQSSSDKKIAAKRGEIERLRKEIDELMESLCK